MNQLTSTLTSLEVSEMVGRPHNDLMKDIRRIQSHFNEGTSSLIYFIPSEYEDSRGRMQPSYDLTKKGCELYATRMNGKEGTLFAIEYIERFNEMENHIKQNQIDTSQLSPELQMFNHLFTAIADTQVQQRKQSERLSQIEMEQERVTEVISLKADADWKDKSNALLNRIAITLGGGDQYRKVRSDSYSLLEKRGKCRLNVRLENLKKDAYARGIYSPSKIKGFNKLDVIANDTRLTEVYLAIVKEMAIAHKVNPEGLGA